MCLIKVQPKDENDNEPVRIRPVKDRLVPVRTASPARRSSARISRISVQSKPALILPAPAAVPIPAPQPVPVFVQPPPPPPPPPPAPASPSPRALDVQYVRVSPRSSVSDRDDYVYRRDVYVERDYSPPRSSRGDRYEYRYLEAPEERRSYRRSPSRSRSRGREYVEDPRWSRRSTRERVIHIDRDGNRDSRYYD